MVARPKIEKPAKELSYKRELEAEHLIGKHSLVDKTSISHAQILATENPECGFCQRRVRRMQRKSKR